jgi:hypothetical protein
MWRGVGARLMDWMALNALKGLKIVSKGLMLNN